MAIKNVVIPWISGGVLLLGYAGFAWLRQRARTPASNRALTHPEYEATPLSDRLERVPGAEVTLDPEPEPASNDNGGSRPAPLGPRFLGRATSALSPFQNKWPQTSSGGAKF